MSIRVLAAAALVFVSSAPTALAAETGAAKEGPAQAAMSRADATGIIRELRRIVTPNGIERADTIRIGGIDQYVTMRGTNRRNPVLLVLHGGPGFPEAALSWWNTRALEEYFVVVHWDQRGSGKTYLLNDPQAVAATMDPEHFIRDTEELVAWLRRGLDKQKVFLLGHSWGSYIGLEFAVRRPEWLHAYIGIGQATNTSESERRGWAFAVAEARKTGNAQAMDELMSIAPYATSGAPIPLEDIMIERRWSDHFGGVMAYRTGQIDGIAARLSPDYTDAEAARVYEGNGYSQRFLFSNVVNLDLSSRISRLRCPLILLEGRHDRTVNSEVAYEWFQRVRTPEKHFVWFEHSAHEVMSEEPGKVLVSLVRYARPIAERAGDVAP